jgi:hypothetical protein
MKRRLILAAAIAVISLGATFVLAADVAHAEAGYASPEFQLRGPISMSCLDTSPQPNLHDRTQDEFACVGPVGTAEATGTLYQVIYVRYRRYYSWGWVTWRCVPVHGPYSRYAHQFANLACSK